MTDLDALLEQLCSAGLLEYATPAPATALSDQWAQTHGVVAAIDGRARVSNRDLSLRLGVTSGFPDRLPVIAVLNQDLHGRLPHVFSSGHICFQEQEGVLLDRYDPVGIARAALSQALEILTAGLAGENRLDYIEELALHWPGEAEGIVVSSIGNEVAPIGRLSCFGLHIFAAERPQAREVIARTLPFLTRPFLTTTLEGLEKLGQLSWSSGLYIPLEEVPDPPDPFPSGPWPPHEITRWLRRHLSPERAHQIERITRKKQQASTFALLRVPRPRGADHVVGVRFDNIKGAHPLARQPGTSTVTPFKVERHDPTYLRPRGGSADLRAARVLLVGCGSIGGHLAMELARCGIGSLDLVDPDILRPENAYRHVLGMPPLLTPPKSALLALEVQRRYPGVRATSHLDSIEHALDSRVIDPTRFSLIISATGNHNVDRGLNDRLYRIAGRGALLFTWLEPLGIGGHAVVVADRTRSTAVTGGCFDCLFTPHPADAAPILSNRAAFAAPGQTFTRELAGCGNAFTPYSSLDALRTAELAARLAVDVLRGDIHGSLLRSWKGRPEAFRREGYRTSPRFELAAETLESGVELEAPQCRVCGAPGGLKAPG